jgi:hypothetical protein
LFLLIARLYDATRAADSVPAAFSFGSPLPVVSSSIGAVTFSIRAQFRLKKIVIGSGKLVLMVHDGDGIE